MKMSINNRILFNSEWMFAMFVYRDILIPFLLIVLYFCVEYTITTVRIWFYFGFEKPNLPIREKSVHITNFVLSYISYNWCFYQRRRPFPRFTLHQSRRYTQRTRVADLVSRHCRARECGTRSKNRGRVSRIRDFFRSARHQQICGNELKSKAGKLRMWGVSHAGISERYVATCESVSCLILANVQTSVILFRCIFW